MHHARSAQQPPKKPLKTVRRSQMIRDAMRPERRQVMTLGVSGKRIDKREGARPKPASCHTKFGTFKLPIFKHPKTHCPSHGRRSSATYRWIWKLAVALGGIRSGTPLKTHNVASLRSSTRGLNLRVLRRGFAHISSLSQVL